ncbi:MAG: O-antigen polymerase [Patescibacteria group bacterium]
MQTFKRYFIENKWRLALVFISAITFHRWFSTDVFTMADWHYYDSYSLKDMFITETWVARFNAGSANSIVWRYPFYFVLGGLSYFGLDFYIIDKFLVFLPIVLLIPASSYSLAKSFKLSNFTSFIVGLIITFNTYYLAIMTQGHILLNLGFAFTTFAFVYYKKGLERNNLESFIYSIVFITVGSFIDFRTVYVTALVMFFYTVTNLKQAWKAKFKLVFYGLSLAISSIYWLLPFYNSQSSFGNYVLDRGLFGNPFWRIHYAISLFYPFWTTGKIFWFTTQPVNPINWILPFFSLCGLIIVIYQRKFKQSIFLGVLGILGIILTKQSDYPFPDLYKWLFNNFPGFLAFREASKFYYFTILSYSVLIGYYLEFLTKAKAKLIKKSIYFFSIVSILTLSFINLFPYLSGRIETIIAKRQIPAEYYELNQFLNSENDFYRTLWVPVQSKWASEINRKPKMSLVDLMTNLLNRIHEQNELEAINPTKNYTYLNLINSNYFEYLLNHFSIKYVIIPIRDKQNDDDFFSYFGNNRGELEQAIRAKNFLESITLPDSKFTIYQNKNYREELKTKSDPIISIREAQEFESKFDFVVNKLKLKNPDFLDFSDEQNKDKNLSTEHKLQITDPFIDTNWLDALQSKDSIKSKINLQKYDTLYISKNNYNLVVVKVKDQLIFYLDSSSPAFDQIEKEEPKRSFLKNIKLSTDLDYYLFYNDTVFKIEDQIETSLGTYKGSSAMQILSSDKNNLVPNGDFEDGLWQESVGDCNEVKKIDRPKYMSSELVSREGTANATSAALLEAKIHSACEQNIFNIPELSYFYFSYDYKVVGENSFSSYNLGFLDTYNALDSENSDLNIKERSFINDSEWNNLSKMFFNPENSQRLEITLYADATSRPNKVIYDNVKLFKLNTYTIFQLENLQEDYKIINTADIISNNLRYLKQYDIRNNILNGDFEGGLWQDEVSDCNNYDNFPEIGMSLGEEKEDDSETIQNKYLELTTRYHLSCTFQDFGFYPGSKKFLLEFDYNTDAEYIGYFVSFNDTANSLIKSNLAVPEDRRLTWNKYKRFLEIPPNATRAVFGFYGYPGTFTARQNTGTSKYDNVKLINLPNITSSSFLVKGNVDKIRNRESYLLDKNNHRYASTRKYDNFIPANTNHIVFSSKYDPNWNLQGHKQAQHFRSLFSTNIWSTDQYQRNGLEELRLHFTPETQFLSLLPISMSYFYILIAVATTTLIKNLGLNWTSNKNKKTN